MARRTGQPIGSGRTEETIRHRKTHSSVKKKTMEGKNKTGKESVTLTRPFKIPRLAHTSEKSKEDKETETERQRDQRQID